MFLLKLLLLSFNATLPTDFREGGPAVSITTYKHLVRTYLIYKYIILLCTILLIISPFDVILILFFPFFSIQVFFIVY